MMIKIKFTPFPDCNILPFFKRFSKNSDVAKQINFQLKDMNYKDSCSCSD